MEPLGGFLERFAMKIKEEKRLLRQRVLAMLLEQDDPRLRPLIVYFKHELER